MIQLFFFFIHSIIIIIDSILFPFGWLQRIKLSIKIIYCCPKTLFHTGRTPGCLCKGKTWCSLSSCLSTTMCFIVVLFLFNFTYNLNAVVTEDAENFLSEGKEMLIRTNLKSCSYSRAVPADSVGQRRAGRPHSRRLEGSQIVSTRIIRVGIVCPHCRLKYRNWFLLL